MSSDHTYYRSCVPARTPPDDIMDRCYIREKLRDGLMLERQREAYSYAYHHHTITK